MRHIMLLIVLLLVVLGLGALLVTLEHKSAADHHVAVEKIVTLSNSVTSATAELNDARATNLVLNSNLAALGVEYSNKFTLAQGRYDEASAELAKVKADAKTVADAAAVELARLDQRIKDLQTHHQDLDTQSAELHAEITNLESEIENTKVKLAKSDGDRTFLIKLLKELQARKDVLEKDFNDLAVVREQIRKIKAVIAEARVQDWIRRGVYTSFTQKGAERLVHPVVVLPPSTNAPWKVEIHQNDGVTPVPTPSPL